jgi:hypothetical protein
MCNCSPQTEREEATWWIDACGCIWKIRSVLEIILEKWSECDCSGSNYGLLMGSCEHDNCKYLVVLKSGDFFCNIRKMMYHISYTVSCTPWHSSLRY